MFQNQKYGCMIMEIINIIKDFLENIKFDLVVNLSDIITIIVFLFTVCFNVYALNKEKKRFEEQIIQQRKQYADNRTLDLKKNQVDCLPIILLKKDIVIEKSNQNNLKFHLNLTNCGNGSAYACHPITDGQLCIYEDEHESDLKYFQIKAGSDLLNIGDSFDLIICSSKLPDNTPHEIYLVIEYYDLMGRKYNQEYRFIYNFPQLNKATRIGNYLWTCVEDIDNNSYKN